MLAAFGRLLEPLGALMGLGDWRMIVALLTSFFAKENTIATLGILFGAGTARRAGRMWPPSSRPRARLAFLVVAMLFIPCLATVATIKQETARGAGRCSALDCCWVLSVGVGVLVYQGGRLVGW